MNIVSSLLVSSKCTERMQVKICCTNHIKPTGNLDSVTSMDVVALLKSCAFRFHQTLVVVTHQEEVAQMSDRILRMSDGKICTPDRTDY